MVLLTLLGCPFGESFDVAIDSGSTTDFCGDTFDTVSAGFEESLTLDGCRWRVVGVAPSGGIALVIDTAAFAEASVGESVEETYTLPSDDVTLEIELGCGFEASCDGVGAVSNVYVATAGTLSVTATADGADSDVSGVLTDVLFEDDSGATMEVADWSFATTLYAAP